MTPEIAILVKVTAVLPLLVTVRLTAELLPVFTVPKVTGLGLNDKLLTGVRPVPVKLIDCGLPVALSVTAMDAVRLPTAEGEKVALMEQALPAGRVAGLIGQLLNEMA